MILGTVIALLGITVGIAVAAIPNDDGKIYGCYAQRNGALRVINAPTVTCGRGEIAISWNQAGVPGEKGDTGDGVENIDAVPCTTDLGPGVIVSDITAPTNLRGGLEFPTTVTCKPTGFSGIQIESYGAPRLTAAGTGIVGPALCYELGDPGVCIWYVPMGTEVTLTATPFTDWVLTPETLWQGLDATCLGQSTCTFTALDEVYIGFVGSTPAE